MENELDRDLDRILDKVQTKGYQTFKDLFELDSEFLSKLKEELRGESGLTPTNEELLGLITPLIPQVRDGEDYILTESDKEEIINSIVSKIKVPVVDKVIERVIEKTEVIKEVPIVTENVVEIERVDQEEIAITTTEYIKSLEGDERIPITSIKGAEALNEIGQLKRNLESLPVTTSFFNGLRGKNLNIVGGIATRSGDTINVSVSSSSSGNPGGADTNVQYNDGGVFGGDDNFTWDKVAQHLAIDGSVDITKGLTITDELDINNNSIGIDLTIPLSATSFGIRFQGFYTDGIRFDGFYGTSDASIVNVFGVLDSSGFVPTSTLTSMFSFGTSVGTSGSQNASLVQGFFSNPNTRGSGLTYSGTITEMSAYEAQPLIRTGTVTNVSLFHGTGPFKGGGGVITNLYGLYLPDITDGSTINRAIRTGLGRVEFGDDLIFGVDNTDDIGASGATRPRTGYFGTNVSSPIFTSTVATGTAPLTVASTTKVTNLNADLLDGLSVGASGSAIPDLSVANRWTGTQTFSAADGSGASVPIRTYKNGAGVSSGFSVGSANGTFASPTDIVLGDIIGTMTFNAYQGGFFRIVAQITCSATENHGGSARGTQYSFASVNDGTTSQSVKLTLNTAGVTISNPLIQYPLSDSTTAAQFLMADQSTNVLTIDTSNRLLDIGGDVKINTVGRGLYIKEGTNATSGRAVLVGGTVVVNTTKVTANSNIQLTSNADGGTPGFQRVSARTAGTSFTITSSNGADTSTISWLLIEPA